MYPIISTLLAELVVAIPGVHLHVGDPLWHDIQKHWVQKPPIINLEGCMRPATWCSHSRCTPSCHRLFWTSNLKSLSLWAPCSLFLELESCAWPLTWCCWSRCTSPCWRSPWSIYLEPGSLFWWCGAFLVQLSWKEGYNDGYILFSNDDILNSKFAQVALLWCNNAFLGVHFKL